MPDDRQREHYPGFEGDVGRVYATSKPWWPPRREAPPGSPNIVIVLADDLGFSDVGCYGGEIPTPAIDALANSGIRFTNFHVTPMCSPTRASLLTGANSHAVGIGNTSNGDPGFPGYTAEIHPDQPTMPQILRDNGYATMAVGKWHLCKEIDLGEGGSKESWPLQKGFEQYYGFLDALTNLHHPHRMYEGNSVVQTDQYPDGYYVTDDLSDRAVRMIRETKMANPDRPFFLYYAHGAVHAPLHAKAEDIARQRGNYDKGWDALREERLARQIELGIVPEGTVLPPRNSEPNEDVQAWDTLSEPTRKVMARYMEVYAAMVETIDESVGRIAAELEALGELDNTIFIFTSDNGASREGRDLGTTSYFSHGFLLSGSAREIPDDVVDSIDDIGGPTTWPHYPRGWAMACNTPFRLYKLTTFRGGHSVPFVVSWPDGGHEKLGAFRGQYTHVTDILPTIAELIGIEMPTDNEPPAEVVGRSFAPALADPEAPVVHGEQYFECKGHRGYYRDGWYAVTFHEQRTAFSKDRWQLYHLDEDLNELVDVADEHPEKLVEMKEAWDDAAWHSQVFPLDEGSTLNRAYHPPFEEPYTRPLRILPGTPTLERFRSQKFTGGRSFTIEVELDYVDGDEGVLVAHGDQGGGYVLFIEDGQVYFEMKQSGSFADGSVGGPRRLEPMPITGGAQRVVLDVRAPGERAWTVTVSVDGEVGISASGLVQLPWFVPFEGIDVGIDRRSPVSWELYQRRGPFPYSGRLTAVTITPGDFAPDAMQSRVDEFRELGMLLE